MRIKGDNEKDERDGGGGIAPSFFTLAPVGSEWSPSHASHFTPCKRANGMHWIGDWVGTRAGLNTVDKKKKKTLFLLGIGPQPSSL
jgi:hypothetical protein